METTIISQIAHKVFMKRPTPDVVQVLFNKTYHISAYTDRWKKTPSGHPMPNPLNYDKLLAEDEERNRFLVDELVKMRRAKRKILVFSRLKAHLKTLKQMFEERIGNVLDAIVYATAPDVDEIEEGLHDLETGFLDFETSVTLLVGGLKPAQLDAAMIGDVIFCTYAFGRDAMNVPHIDTLLMATPPGKVLQPIGRLRDKGPVDRQPLLCLDPYENVPYSVRKAGRREQTYLDLNIKVIHKTRTV